MCSKPIKTAVFNYLSEDQSDIWGNAGLSLPELKLSLESAELPVAERTLRRWLHEWCNAGWLLKKGRKRGTRYHPVKAGDNSLEPGFLSAVEPARRHVVLSQLRNVWTHHSTAIEGNTLTLGDTYSVLELGLTVGGKPLREHHEVVGHARAIDLLYAMLTRPMNKDDLFALHRAVQKEIVGDILNPVGAWKREPNYASSLTSHDEQVTIEYAVPDDVDVLMEAWLTAINQYQRQERGDVGYSLAMDEASRVYATNHIAFAHIHPFADGNGRMARLVSNIPLLRHGLPPLVIDRNRRREYIQLLADYQSTLGPLTKQHAIEKSLWPEADLLQPFIKFCEQNYALTREIVERAENKSE